MIFPSIKTSQLYKHTDEEFEEIVKSSQSYTEIQNKLYQNKPPSSAHKNFKTIHNRIRKLNIDDSHIRNNQLKNIFPLKQLDLMLVESSTASRSTIKRKLLSENIIEYKCSVCGMGPEWNGQSLSLQLDHINGVNNDHRLENLRFLCPNCHSQTSTFCGKSSNKPKEKQIKPGVRKLDWPSSEELQKFLWEIPITKISKIYGVSSKSIEYWAKTYNLTKPTRGYWEKKRAEQHKQSLLEICNPS